MKKIVAFSVVLLSALSLSGCFDSSSNGGNARPDPSVSFSTFVQTQFRATSDTTDPVEINGIDFSFNSQTNEQAFDNLLIN